jgi:hypothetical protein
MPKMDAGQRAKEIAKAISQVVPEDTNFEVVVTSMSVVLAALFTDMRRRGIEADLDKYLEVVNRSVRRSVDSIESNRERRLQ